MADEVDIPQLSVPAACLWPNGAPGITYPNSTLTVAQALNSYSASNPEALVRPRILDSLYV